MHFLFLFFIALIVGPDLLADTGGSSSGGTYSAAGMSQNAVEIYTAILTSLKNIKWIFAILPGFAVIYVIYATMGKHENMVEQGGVGTNNATVRINHLINIFIGIVGAIASSYLIIGIFSIVFANATSMSSAWDGIVVSFWIEVIAAARQ